MSRMVTFICMGDLHLTDKPAKSCRLKDVEFFELQMNLLEQVYKHVKTMAFNEVDTDRYILLPGDVFDRWNTTPHVVKVFKEWVEKVSVYAEVISTYGQHDVQSHAFSNWENNSYLPLSGVHYTPHPSRPVIPIGFEPGVYGFDKLNDTYKDRYHVFLWHLSASPNPVDNIAHLDEVPIKDNALYVLGDIHDFKGAYHPPHMPNSVFLSAGSLLPMKVDEWRKGIKPGYHVVRFNSKKKPRVVEYEWVDLELPEGVPDPLYDERIVLDMEVSADLTDSVDRMGNRLDEMKQESDISDEALLRRIADEVDINPLAVDLALDLVRVTK